MVRFFLSCLLLSPLFLTMGCGNRQASSGQEPGSPASGPVMQVGAEASDSAALADLRNRMVRDQIQARGVRDSRVLKAMAAVPRHRFVPGSPPEAAYTDRPLPIGYGQTISQPFIVAFMVEAAEVDPEDRVLEIGTGSGYGAAVLGELARAVYTVEIVPELAARARDLLGEMAYQNIHVQLGNGWLGWPEHAPYDAIVVTAAPERIPDALKGQLALGGTMVIPVGDLLQELQVLRMTEEGLEVIRTLPVRFVPLVGEPPDTGGSDRGG